MLSERGFLVIDADTEAKTMMSTDTTVQTQLSRHFGPDIFQENQLSFSRLGEKAFESPDQLNALNSLVHPSLIALLDRRLQSVSQPLILDAALIPLWHIEHWFDILLWIRARPEKRFERLTEKTHLSENRIIHRMELQESILSEPTTQKWHKIQNEGTKEDLASQLSFITCG